MQSPLLGPGGLIEGFEGLENVEVLLRSSASLLRSMNASGGMNHCPLTVSIYPPHGFQYASMMRT